MVKEFQNSLSGFYGFGSEASNLPASKRVYTETEVQAAISKALLSYGVRCHLEPDLDGIAKAPIDNTHINGRCPETADLKLGDELRFNDQGYLCNSGKPVLLQKGA